jgi:Spy/CpxP family protein refolding chaperone
MSSNTKRRGFILAVLVVGILAFAATGSARPEGKPGHGIERMERAISQLEVSGEVQESIYALLDEARAEVQSRRPEMREAHEALRALMHADAPDEEAILAQAERLGALETEARKARLSTMLQVHALLTPEQREELMQLRERRGFRREGR